jgi:nucleoside-diphosphate-sugar epimerase
VTHRVAIVGSNGSVGTELALRLRDVRDIAVVGVCRNPAGSAYLRLGNVDCLHGEFADPNEARRMLKACEVVVQLAYRPPRSRREYLVNRAIATNAVLAAPEGCHVLFASTIMVYAPDLSLRIPSAYGLEKLRLERLVRGLGHTADRPTTLFRMGHTLGPFQPQSIEVLAAVREGVTQLPEGGRRPSNTVFVASLADVVVQAARGLLRTGTFDLISQPQWTWADVFRHYANEIGREFYPADGPTERPSITAAIGPRLRAALAWMPDSLAERAYGLRLSWKARSCRPPPQLRPTAPRATAWRGVGRAPMAGLLAPLEALDRYPLPALPSVRSLPPGWHTVGCNDHDVTHRKRG